MILGVCSYFKLNVSMRLTAPREMTRIPSMIPGFGHDVKSLSFTPADGFSIVSPQKKAL